MLDLDPWTIAFQAINFLILLAGLTFLLFRPAMRRVREREAERERVNEQMIQDRQEAERIRHELEGRLASIEEEAGAIVAQAREQAEIERVALLEEAREEADRTLAEAHANVDRLWEQRADDFSANLIDTVLDVCREVIGHVAPAEIHDTMIKELSDRIWEMGRSEMEQVETFRRSLGDREPTAHVVSARQLSPEQQGLLARTFTALADRHVNLELKIDPALVAGSRVRLADILVDHSIAGQLDELRETVAQTLEDRSGYE